MLTPTVMSEPALSNSALANRFRAICGISLASHLEDCQEIQNMEELIQHLNVKLRNSKNWLKYCEQFVKELKEFWASSEKLLPDGTALKQVRIHCCVISESHVSLSIIKCFYLLPCRHCSW